MKHICTISHKHIIRFRGWGGGGNIWDKIVFQILKFLRMCLFRRLIFFRILLGYLSFKVLVLKFVQLHLRLSYFQVLI